MDRIKEWQSLMRAATLHRASLDQYWREIEQFKDSLASLLDAMPKEGSVLRSILMLSLLTISANMLERQLAELEENLS